MHHRIAKLLPAQPRTRRADPVLALLVIVALIVAASLAGLGIIAALQAMPAAGYLVAAVAIALLVGAIAGFTAPTHKLERGS